MIPFPDLGEPIQHFIESDRSGEGGLPVCRTELIRTLEGPQADNSQDGWRYPGATWRADQGILKGGHDPCCVTSFTPRSMNLGRLAD